MSTASSASAWLRRNGWVQGERGWWTNWFLGGICRERDGKWYLYTKDDEKLGPFKTAVAAAQCVNRKEQ